MTEDTSSTRSQNFIYAASYAGFVGAGVLALCFLVRDAIMGSPLLTPSIFGAAIFQGAVPTDPTVRLDQVALVSLVHVALFTSVGAPFAYLVYRVERLQEYPLVMAAGIFAALGVGIASLDALLLPGLVAAIGPVSVTVANALTAGAMSAFYREAFALEAATVSARR